MDNLIKYGADEGTLKSAEAFPKLSLARVAAQYKDIYKVITDSGEGLAEVSGKLRYEAGHLYEYPAVGDFVMTDKGDNAGGNIIIKSILPRKSVFRRSAVGAERDSQIIATNIDYIFICMSLNENYSLSRMERYLSAAWDSGAAPVVILTKADLCPDTRKVLSDVFLSAPGAEAIAVSADDTDSYQRILEILKPGVTASFIGSSGVGKSTLINRLAGEDIMATSEIRSDGKGRHTTTRREMLLLPSGAIVIDTPGMREFGVESADLSTTFSDIDSLAEKCKFRDCTHTNEPGCAVLKAIEEGTLDQRRFDNYIKLKKEILYDGLSSKEIETEKFNTMFKDIGGVKNIRKFNRENNKRK